MDLCCVCSRGIFGACLNSMGYPKPPLNVLDDGMILAYSFEKNFAFDSEDISKSFPCDIHQSVLALASLNASLVRESGDGNKIDENLRIEVLLPNGQCREGTLHHYNLHYNVALVSINDKDFHALQQILNLAAGIGGPLIGLEGQVICMNFYDTKIGIPFLPGNLVLAYFERESNVAEVGNGSDPSDAIDWKIGGDDSVKLNMFSSDTSQQFSQKSKGLSEGSNLSKWDVIICCRGDASGQPLSNSNKNLSWLNFELEIYFCLHSFV
uniref:Uncharacterized protein n=2 Tax=Leersia perrieri TaxID=77586 RepID=A0A0D9W199_9ORYZ